jgi:hypothetical protein
MSIDEESHTARARGRRRLLIVAAVFFVPFLGAILLHSAGWRPGEQVNRGTLLSPPAYMPPFQATIRGARAPAPREGTWKVLVIGRDGCESGCRQALDDTRRVVDLLGHDRDRVQRVLVATRRLDVSMVESHRDLIGLDAAAAPNPALLAPFAEAPDGAVFVVDPQRYIMLRYEPGQDAKDLFDDLKRLLKYSG